MMDKSVVAVCISITLFITVMFGTIVYNNSQLHECRKIGMERSMSATDIQAICR
jgi:hypothetical protein